MNMKKSIAGVMAGALAVSAIATTASAWTGGSGDQEQIVLSYDLNEEKHAWSAGSATIKYDFMASDVGYAVTGKDTWVENGNTYHNWANGKTLVQMGAELTNWKEGSYMLDTVTVTGTGFEQADGKSETKTKSFSRKNAVGSDGKNDTIKIGANGTKKDTSGNIYAFEVPFTSGNNNNGFNMDRFKMGVTKATDAKYEPTGAAATEFATEAAAAAATTINFNVVKADPANIYEWTLKYKTPAVEQETATDTAAHAAASNTGYLTEGGALEAMAANPTEYVKATTSEVGDIVDFKVNKDAATGKYFVYAVKVTTKAEAEGTPVTETFTTAEGRDTRKAALLATPGTKYTFEETKADKAGNKYYVTDSTGTYYLGRDKYVEGTAAGAGTGYGFKQYDVVLSYTIVFKDNVENEWSNGDWELTWGVNAAFEGIDVGGWIGQYAPNFVKPTYGTYYKPMRTDWNAPAEIVSRLTDLGYTYPQAVLNDVIANNENVAFTFTTAQSYVDNRKYVKIKADDGMGKEACKWTSSGAVAAYNVQIENPLGGLSVWEVEPAKIYAVGGTEFIENPYYGAAFSGNKDNDFTGVKNDLWYYPVFTQGLYQKFTWNGKNGYTASGPNGSQGAKDQFGSYASIWNTNLNSAGLVANSRWTMQLSDVDAFEWGDSTITFFWDAITDEANVTNAANFLTSLQLYTPNEWFWDKLDVAVGAAIAEDVGADAPLEEDAEEVVEDTEATEEEIIDEEPVDDFEEEEPVDDFEDDFEDEEFDETEPEPVDEPEEEVTEPVEEEPDTIEVSSPKTGNAPVALAVIPVALAAAAVVAKKRK